MKVSFNVLNDAWIPVIGPGEKREMLGIRDLLRRAPELQEISSASPLEEYSLYRFLSVFLMDALRPETVFDLKKLLSDGVFDMSKIEQYIALCESEGVTFDLFDRFRPFMQSAYDEKWDKEEKPVGYIDCFLPSGNNHMHFEHTKPALQSVTADKAARLLLVVQMFCTAMGGGYPSGVNASPPYFGVIKEKSLFETLVYTLLPIEDILIPFDTPPVIWRSSEPVIPRNEIEQTSWLRGMLFPARRVSLIRPQSGTDVTKVYLSQGENFYNKTSWIDPFVSYRTLETGRAPFRPKKEKPVWRSLYNIVDIPGNHASQLLTQYMQMTNAPYVEITLYGVETNQASYVDVMRHDLRFRSDITGREPIISLVKRSVEAAERLGRKLARCFKDGDFLHQSMADAAVNSYYTEVETQFWTLCDACADTAIEKVDELYTDWCDKIGRCAVSAYNNAIRYVNLRGNAATAAAEQSRWLYYEIKQIKNEIENKEEESESD